MQQDKAAKHFLIGGIHNGIRLQPGDVSLPQADRIRKGTVTVKGPGNDRDLLQGYDAFFLCAFFQVRILHCLHFCRQRSGPADVHQRTQQPPLLFRIPGHFQVTVSV